MAMTTKLVALTGGLFTALALIVASVATAAEEITGYRSAEFGMSSEAVLERLEQDGVTDIEIRETEDNDRLIDGELQVEGEPVTDLRYVFPAGSDRLALVVAFYPDVADHAAVKDQLVSQYGQPWGEEMTEWWFEQLKEGMPVAPNDLTIWGGSESERQERSRFVRLWAFDDYLTVEYLDTRLLR
ncbi:MULTISPECIES: hypothetical protein [unclassified Halomonas]|jgi:hypothetical protein|uniref:hypothetical protein n=1 Tax=unclassified Halomonas TaxID=2609666 RepID=UPI000288FF73|nr:MULTISPECIES: hypothetical protein [unclassified Halomonas]MCE8036083.1 hypothetical protein [Halomonas sp. MCCC 1A11062]